MSVGAGMYFNTVLFGQMSEIIEGVAYDASYFQWALPAMLVQLEL